MEGTLARSLALAHLEEVDKVLHHGDVRVELHLARAVQDQVVLVREAAQLFLFARVHRCTVN